MNNSTGNKIVIILPKSLFLYMWSLESTLTLLDFIENRPFKTLFDTNEYFTDIASRRRVAGKLLPTDTSLYNRNAVE